MPNRLADLAAVRFLIAECTEPGVNQQSHILSAEADLTGDQQGCRQLAALAIRLAAKVQLAIQQGMNLGILDQEGRLQVPSLVTRGMLDSNGQAIQDIFGRRLPCQP